jgi:Transcriptional regulator containing PAS, AAA-type ATPase, and DNA-binding domains
MPPHPLSNLKVQDLFSRNQSMARCLKLASLAAESDVPVLILGETGTGKTLLAQAIHNSSTRSKGKFVSFNASAMSDTLLESQLFGHERGAFTGAQKTVKGKFELADSGTLFLDEIADMSSLAQAKILRAVEYGEFERLGSERMLRSNARIISATNTSLREGIRNGRFREDLFHRLAGLTLLIPPLRDRCEDLPGLIAVELDVQARHSGRKITSIHPAAMNQLLTYGWPGNLRELHHTIRTVILFCEGEEVLPDHIVFQPSLYSAELQTDRHTPGLSEATMPAQVSHSNGEEKTAISEHHSDLSLHAALRKHLIAVYEQTGRNQRQTARVLEISRSRLARHLRSLEP